MTTPTPTNVQTYRGDMSYLYDKFGDFIIEKVERLVATTDARLNGGWDKVSLPRVRFLERDNNE